MNNPPPPASPSVTPPASSPPASSPGASPQLTADSVTRLAAILRTPKHLIPLLEAGLSEEACVTLLTIRHQYGRRGTLTPSDAAFYKACPDSHLLIRLADADVHTGELLSAGEGRIILTVDDLDRCLQYEVEPVLATSLIRRAPATGEDPLEQLIETLAAHPDAVPDDVAAALAYGADPSDIAWVLRMGCDLAAIRGLDQASATLRDGRSAEERRVTLLLTGHLGYGTAYANGLAAAIADTAWTDMAVRLIADGTPVDQAIRVARADHQLEQKRTINRAVTGPVGSGPSRT